MNNSDRFFNAFIFVPGAGNARVQSLETGSIVVGSWQPVLACSICGAPVRDGDCLPTCPSKAPQQPMETEHVQQEQGIQPKTARKRKLQ